MLFFCKRRHLTGPGSRKATLEEHLVWMKEKHDAHEILLSGPSPDLVYGMYLIQAESLEDADKIASSDPYTIVGDTDYELIQWNVRQIMGVGPFTEDGLGLSGLGL